MAPRCILWSENWMHCEFLWSDIWSSHPYRKSEAICYKSFIIGDPPTDGASQSIKSLMMIVKLILVLSLATLSMARCRGIHCFFKSKETRWQVHWNSLILESSLPLLGKRYRTNWSENTGIAKISLTPTPQSLHTCGFNDKSAWLQVKRFWRQKCIYQHILEWQFVLGKFLTNWE